MIKVIDIALLALGGVLLITTSLVCAVWRRPLTHAVKLWVLFLLFLFLLALSGCATTSMSTRLNTEKAQGLIQGHVSEIAQKIQVAQKSESRPSQKSEPTKQTDPVVLTREQWLLVRSAQLRRQAKIKLQRIELDACKKQNQVNIQRERKKREQAQEQHKRSLASAERRAMLPWVIVGVTATAAFVGFALYIGKIAP